MDKIRVLVVDDHPLFREGVAEILSRDPGVEVIAQGATADEAVRLASTYLPDILLLDIEIPGGGINAIQRVAAKCPVTHIVMLTASENNLMPALKAGARGYVLKGVSGQELLSIVYGVMAGESYVTPSLAAGMLREMSRAKSASEQAPNLLDALNERERQILEQVAKGASNREIGLSLGLSEKTVKHYMTNVLQKLQVRNRVEAALWAQKDAQSVK